ncbi:MAG: TonB-dependent receptor [Sphingomonas sanxanigenens]|uniref:TonB-dependent receptor n=1 Tax=Sphingomonas sanxanigenens TaxID=397260 RepID=A0A2W5A5C5_9SPHN|nr:MAG: TonB-dependent receptor [Sphingomonas sanxanigenens]
MKNRLFIGAAVAALIAPAAIHAQETTSSIRGFVTSGGAAVAGATVTVTHVPSGTRSVTTTNNDGSFTLSGLRIGGPYTVDISAPGYANTQVTDITTNIGQAYDVPVELAAEGGEDIVVTATSLKGAGSISEGPATILNANKIAQIATVNRDIRDLMRRDPFARLDDTPSGGRAVSFAGQNARFNRFSVDGVAITDNFGLNPDGLPSRRSPIPLDAIGEFQTKVAPYDVREGNFQGGAINIVLKSGTNDFHGTGFFAYSSDNLSGDRTKAGPGVPTGRVTLPNYTYKNFGAELSGPIIKDKLFFMISGERLRASKPIAEGPGDNNAGTAIPGLTEAQVDNVVAIAKSRYNYDAGEVLKTNGDRDDRLVGKIDANLSDTQRLSLTGTYAKDSIYLLNNTSAATSGPQLGLSSNAYKQGNQLYTGVAQLNSDWSDNFSTEVRGFYKYYKRIQDPLMGRGFAQMRVCAAPTSDRATGTNPTGSDKSTACGTDPSGNIYPVISIGPDNSRQTNALHTNTFGGSFQARLTMGDHQFRAFAEYSNVKIFNAFLQNTSGNYYFDSIADFQAGNAQSVAYQNAIPSLNPDEAAARFKYQSYTFGLQDNWRLTDTLNVSYGVRYDLYGGQSRAAFNQNFFNRYGFVNNAFLDGRSLFQPRFGFDWKPTSRLTVRGGGGIFGGGAPDVYVSNSFSNTGILTNTVSILQLNNSSYSVPGGTQAVGSGSLTNVNGFTIPSVLNAYLQNASVATASTTNALDPHFKIPSQWRATLSADYVADLGPLGDKWRFGADLLYSSVRNQVLFTDLRSVPIAGSLTPDGRQRYTGLLGFSDRNSDYYLTNTKLGRSYIAVARIGKSWDFGLDANASFTYQDVTDQAPATSSTASSNYGNGAFLDANQAAYGTSNDEVKYAFKYDLTFDHAFFGDNKTTISLFGETRIGRPFSYTFNDVTSRSSVFGTVGSGARYLLYVPTIGGDPRVSYDSAATQAAFENFIKASGLSKYQGKIAPRNAFNSKWFTRLDLHVAQEIPTGLGHSKLQIFADIENFTNLINKNWGQIREYSFPYTFSPVRVACLTTAGNANGAGTVATNTSQACAQYRYSNYSKPSDTIYASQSLYSIRIGARFTF